jgi:hypothetical protein
MCNSRCGVLEVQARQPPQKHAHRVVPGMEEQQVMHLMRSETWPSSSYGGSASKAIQWGRPRALTTSAPAPSYPIPIPPYTFSAPPRTYLSTKDGAPGTRDRS